MPATPESNLQAAVARLAAAGASQADQRDALAVLSLIAAGLDPEVFATSRKAGLLSEQLGLNLAGWPRVVGLLESAGVITGAGRSGRRGIAAR